MAESDGRGLSNMRMSSLEEHNAGRRARKAKREAEQKRIKVLIEEARQEQQVRYGGSGKVLKCREASPLSVSSYIACGERATRFILSERGTRVYPMCDGCASHNVRNRDCEDVGKA